MCLYTHTLASIYVEAIRSAIKVPSYVGNVKEKHLMCLFIVSYKCRWYQLIDLSMHLYPKSCRKKVDFSSDKYPFSYIHFHLYLQSVTKK